MPAIIIPMKIPDKFIPGLNSGEYFLLGGVIRRQNGSIAGFLANVPEAEKAGRAVHQAVNGSVTKAVNFVKSHKAAVTTGATALLLAAGTCIYLVLDNKNQRVTQEANLSDKVNAFQEALNHYIQDATQAKLTIADIDQLIAALDDLEHTDQSQIDLEFSSDELRTLVQCIIDYTSALSEANHAESDAAADNSSCSVISLKEHLKRQREIIKQAS